MGRQPLKALLQELVVVGRIFKKRRMSGEDFMIRLSTEMMVGCKLQQDHRCLICVLIAAARADVRSWIMLTTHSCPYSD
jgi:hypothetical protein